MVIVRRTVLISVAVLLSNDFFRRGYWLCVSTIIFLFIHVLARPFSTRLQNRSETLALVTLVLVALTLMAAPVPLTVSYSIGLAALVLSVGALFVFPAIAVRVDSMWRRFASARAARAGERAASVKNLYDAKFVGNSDNELQRTNSDRDMGGAERRASAIVLPPPLAAAPPSNFSARDSVLPLRARAGTTTAVFSAAAEAIERAQAQARHDSPRNVYLQPPSPAQAQAQAQGPPPPAIELTPQPPVMALAASTPTPAPAEPQPAPLAPTAAPATPPAAQSPASAVAVITAPLVTSVTGTLSLSLPPPPLPLRSILFFSFLLSRSLFVVLLAFESAGDVCRVRV